MRVEKEDNYFYSDDVKYDKLMNVNERDQHFEQNSYPANEAFYIERDSKRTSVRLESEDDSLQCELRTDMSNGGRENVSSCLFRPRVFPECHYFDGHERDVSAEAGLLCETKTERPHGKTYPDDKGQSGGRSEPLAAPFITMENSNNAIDSASIFKDIRHRESGHSSDSNHTFKLPNSELTFNGTLKQLQKLNPIVDPSTAYNVGLENLNDLRCLETTVKVHLNCKSSDEISNSSPAGSEKSEKFTTTLCSSISQFPSETTYSNVDEFSSSNVDGVFPGTPSDRKTCSSLDVSLPTLNEPTNATDDFNSGSKCEDQNGESFNSGVESPDLFYDDEDSEDDLKIMKHNETNGNVAMSPVFDILELCDRRGYTTIEKKLHGIPPPPSVTMCYMNAADMLRLYNANLPLYGKTFCGKFDSTVSNSTTPPKTQTVSFQSDSCKIDHVTSDSGNTDVNQSKTDFLTSSEHAEDKRSYLINCTQQEAEGSPWPDVLKHRYHGVYYNINDYTEMVESLFLRYIDRYIGAENATTISGLTSSAPSPSSAQKRKLRSKLAPAKSPGRRLSHLARRRQTFCNASTIAESASTSSKMVLIDRNFFPHRKLTGFQRKKMGTPGKKLTRKSPTKRTPGKRTPRIKTPGKKTPRRTPSSTKKIAVRKHAMPTRSIEKSKRALFVSPEQSAVAQPSRDSAAVIPEKVLKTRRTLFGSPETVVPPHANTVDAAEFERKRKREEEGPMQRHKLQKSFSFCGSGLDNGSRGASLLQRASQSQSTISYKMSDLHEKKLIWAVAQALRDRGFGREHSQWRQHASTLRHVLRVLFSLPANLADIADTKKSTSDTMLKLAREYVYFVVSGTTLDEILAKERLRIASLNRTSRLSVYLQGSQDIPVGGGVNFARWNSENSYGSVRSQRASDAAKTVLQDKAVNIENANSNSSIGSFMSDASFKSDISRDSHTRARRQIKFDNIDVTSKR